MRRWTVIAVAVTLAMPAEAANAPKPAVPDPYVTVYRDDAVAFQVRRDRIKSLPDQIYRVWLRWLWAKPRLFQNRPETARIIVAHVDCANVRVRELAVLHKDRSGKIFASEEVPSPDAAPWTSFEPESAAAAAVERLCEFIPKLQSHR